jgi:hypothetical protein
LQNLIDKLESKLDRMSMLMQDKFGAKEACQAAEILNAKAGCKRKPDARALTGSQDRAF